MARAPTIGDLRERGGRGATVSCRFCRRKATISFEQLRAPDEAIFAEIFERRRFRCTDCGSTKIGFTVDWAPPSPGGLL